jgi:hypothetical protein
MKLHELYVLLENYPADAEVLVWSDLDDDFAPVARATLLLGPERHDDGGGMVMLEASRAYYGTCPGCGVVAGALHKGGCPEQARLFRASQRR